MRADGYGRTASGAFPTPLKCGPGSWRRWRARAAPGSCAGRRPPPAGAWRRNGAGRAVRRPPRRLADRHDARLGALTEDAKLLPVEIDSVEIEVNDLLGAQAARVSELEERTVAKLEG